jgi:hypothetical protein
MRRDDRLEVPLARSSFSTRATVNPRIVAARAMPQPVIPPPITRTSNLRSPSALHRSARAAIGDVID